MKILLGDFNAKVGREIIFKPTLGQESLHQDSNDNGVRLVKFATSKNLVVKSTKFLTGTFTNTPGPPLMIRFTTRLTTYRKIGDGIQVYWMCEILGEVTVIQITIW